MGSRRAVAELNLKFRRFRCKFYTVVFEKLIVGFSMLPLA